MSHRGLEGVLEHYRNPRNYGAIADPDATAEDLNELCGDRVRFQVKLEGTTVRQVGFVGDGCAIMVASASILTELVTGRTVAEVAAISADELCGSLDHGNKNRAVTNATNKMPMAA